MKTPYLQNHVENVRNLLGRFSAFGSRTIEIPLTEYVAMAEALCDDCCQERNDTEHNRQAIAMEMANSDPDVIFGVVGEEWLTICKNKAMRTSIVGVAYSPAHGLMGDWNTGLESYCENALKVISERYSEMETDKACSCIIGSFLWIVGAMSIVCEILVDYDILEEKTIHDIKSFFLDRGKAKDFMAALDAGGEAVDVLVKFNGYIDSRKRKALLQYLIDVGKIPKKNINTYNSAIWRKTLQR